MCIICTDPNCDHGERCGRVKIYKEGGSASDLLDSRGEWEPRSYLSRFYDLCA